VLQNNLLNIAEDRCLSVLKLMALALVKFKPYTGQEPPEEYLDNLLNKEDLDSDYPIKPFQRSCLQ